MENEEKKISIEEAKAVLEKYNQERIPQCAKEVGEILAKYGATIQIQIVPAK